VLNCTESIGITLTHTLKCFIAGTVPPGSDWWSLDESDGDLTPSGYDSGKNNYINMYGKDAWEKFSKQLESAEHQVTDPDNVWEVELEMSLKNIKNKTKNVVGDDKDK